MSDRARLLLAWSSDHLAFPLPEHHPFPLAKYRAVRERLLADGVLGADELSRSDEAPLEWLRLAHDDAYLERTLTGAWREDELRRLGLPWSHALVARARAAAFGTVCAARAAFEHGIAGNLAGGTHHAFRDRGEAYCLFNDAAVAAAVLPPHPPPPPPPPADLDRDT